MGPATSRTWASGNTTMAMRRIATASLIVGESLEPGPDARALFQQPGELRVAARDGLRVGLDLVVHAGELGGQVGAGLRQGVHRADISPGAGSPFDPFPT